MVGSAAAWPLAARGQELIRARRVGVLMNSAATDATYQSYLAAFTEALHLPGWIEAQNLRIDVRWSAGDAALARIYAAQLIGLRPSRSSADGLTPSMGICARAGRIAIGVSFRFMFASTVRCSGLIPTYPRSTNFSAIR